MVQKEDYLFNGFGYCVMLYKVHDDYKVPIDPNNKMDLPLSIVHMLTQQCY
jgi:hypothetical protein